MTTADELRPGAWREARSPYAWMSVRDGELVKTILLNAGTHKVGRLRVLEWGAGQSTLEYSRILSEQRIRFYWLTLEYDRDFFDTSLAPELLDRADTVLRYADDDRTIHGPVGDTQAIVEAVCWNHTALRPAEDVADRTADLDDYVAYPASTGGDFDVVIVDGRKRRRCLLAMVDLMGPDTVVLLHDAWHSYYHCALERYPVSKFFGDELWVGARSAARIDDVLQE